MGDTVVEKPDITRSLDDTLEAIDALFAGRGPLAGIKPNYAPRHQQIQLAREVARALYGGDTLLADCPTGTGKGLAYLAAGVLAEKPLVVSTATLALQAQLLHQDLPLLRKAVCKLYDYPEEEGFSYAVMKGRKNWLCQNRFESTLGEGTLLGGRVLQDLSDFRDSTRTGDREDLQKPVPLGKWVEVASDGEDCAPNVCSYRDECFYYAHREKASSASITVYVIWNIPYALYVNLGVSHLDLSYRLESWSVPYSLSRFYHALLLTCSLVKAL